MYRILFFGLIIGIIGCKNESNKEEPDEVVNINRSQLLDSLRDDVKKTPVAKYDVPLPENLNNWHFTVELYETKHRFDYLLQMQYESITGEETISFPNFGLEPRPEIRKGKNNLECIIGFLDKQDVFREYIKVYIEDENLKMRTIKHYSVFEK